MSTDATDDHEDPATAGGTPDSGTDDEELSRPELAARLDLLEAENRRLREAYARSRRSTYRRTAVGLAAVGTVAALGAVAFPESSTVLFSLAAIGVFAAVLTYYLTPERFVAATVGEAVYTAHADNGDAVVAELGLADRRLYVPLADPTRAATLYVPQEADDAVPPADDLGDTFVAGPDGERGVSLRPTGGALFREFERALSGPLADEPGPLADQLADGLAAGFELADGVDTAVDSGGTRCVFGVHGSAFGPADRFDHPIASFLAVGLAVGLGRPVEAEVTPGDDRVDFRVTCSWTGETDDGTGDEGEA
ncbi:MAG: hypothetical protein ABEH66_05195 [Halobacteriales archaeon]